MIDSEQWMDIKELHRQGMSQRQIAQRTGHSRNTIAKVLEQSAPQPFRKPEQRRPSALDPFKPYLQERYRLYQLSGVRLHEEIVAQGFCGSVDIVQRYLKTLKEQHRASASATVRFETAPGEQAQADWAQVGVLENRKVYAFVLVLGFSRLCFIAFTHCMALPDLLRCHQEAFAYLGGVPSKILYDNMAQVRLPHSKQLHPLMADFMADFAAHYGFAVTTHRPYRPRTKGKVERSVRFVEDNFLKGRAFADLADLAAQGKQWLEKVNQRVHATTGERPIDTLGREKLTPIGSFVPYVLAQRHERRVDAEGFVQVQRARYSVPPQFVGKRVVVALGEQQVTVRLGETIIAEHRPVPAGQSAVDAQHVAAFWKLATQQPVPAGCVTPMNVALSPVAAPAVEVRPLAVYEELAA